MQWLRDRFDPAAFAFAMVNYLLRKLKRPQITEGQLREILMARDGYN